MTSGASTIFTGSDRNLQRMLEHPKFKVLSHDICQPFGDDTPAVDAIFNLACPAAPVHQKFDPVQVLKTTVVPKKAGRIRRAYRARMAAAHGIARGSCAHHHISVR